MLVRDPENRREPQAFFSSDTSIEPAQIIALFVRRWQNEVTFAETRVHIGVETQRQLSDNTIARITPALLGKYGLVTLWAGELLNSKSVPYSAAWYQKTSLTISDAIGTVRLVLWVGDINQHSPPNREPKIFRHHASHERQRRSASPRKPTKSSLDLAAVVDHATRNFYLENVDIGSQFHLAGQPALSVGAGGEIQHVFLFLAGRRQPFDIAAHQIDMAS